jgi:hypothetical protein
MQLGRIHSPAQKCKEERSQTGKGGNSRKDLPEPTRQRRLGCGRTRHPAQAGRAGELIVLVRHAFAAERSSAVQAPRRRFAQRMK